MKVFKLLTPFITIAVMNSASVMAGPAEQAKFLNDRIVGTSMSPAEFNANVTLIQNGNAKQAALNMTKRADFYNIKLKTFFAPRTGEDSSNLVDFNDYIGTLIGIVRDDVPYKDALSADLTYTGTAASGVAPYSQTDDNHYKELHTRRIDLSNPANFVGVKQSELPGSPLSANATAGIITTRAAAKSFFIDGTNRAMTRYLSMNYLCRDFEALHDVSRPQDRVFRDISRNAPFLQECVGCHAGQDGIAGAWAYYNYNDTTSKLEYTPGVVQSKYSNNAAVHKKGYVTVDDSWVNYWRVGQNSALNWRATIADAVTINPAFGHSSGNGAKSMGREIASSKAFSACAVKQIYENVCLRVNTQLTSNDKIEIERIAGVFEAANYNYREIWAEVGISCMGQ